MLPDESSLAAGLPEPEEGTRAWYRAAGQAFESARVRWLRSEHSDLLPHFQRFRQAMEGILGDITRNTELRNYTDHSVVHSQVVMGLVSKLLEHPRLVELGFEEVEHWGLLLACYLHDHKMVHGEREGHALLSDMDLESIDGLHSLAAGLEIPIPAIQHVCALHSSSTPFDPEDVKPLRTNLLGALIRLADSLDYTAERLPSQQYLDSKPLEPKTITEYRNQESIRRIHVRADQIEVEEWSRAERHHLIQSYLEKDYPKAFLAGFNVAFRHTFVEADGARPASRTYLCAAEAPTRVLSSPADIAQVAGDPIFFGSPVPGHSELPLDWATFRGSVAVADLFSPSPADFAATLKQPGLHLVTGPPGSGKSAFLLMALEALLSRAESERPDLQMLPRRGFEETLRNLAAKLAREKSPRPLLLVLDDPGAGEGIGPLRDALRALSEAVRQAPGKLSAVATAGDDEWAVVGPSIHGALVRRIPGASDAGLRKLLGRILKARGLASAEFSPAEVEELAENGATSSPALNTLANHVVKAAEGAPFFVTALVADWAATGRRDTTALPTGLVSLLERRLERLLAAGEIPFLATLRLLERAQDGLSSSLLDAMLAQLAGGATPEAIQATRQFRLSNTGGEEERERLARPWHAALRALRRSKGHALRQLETTADTEVRKFLEPLGRDPNALETSVGIELFDDLVSLRDFAHALALLESGFVPAEERALFEGHLRAALWRDLGSHSFGIEVDPEAEPLLALCLDALLRDARDTTLKADLERSSGLSAHPLALLYRAEFDRISAAFPRTGGPDAVNRDAARELYAAALTAAASSEYSIELRQMIRILHAAFLYNACGERDEAKSMWRTVDVETEGRRASRQRGLALHFLGLSAFHDGDSAQMLQRYTEAWECLHAADDYVGLSRLGTSIADALAFRYDLDAAHEKIEFCLRVKRLTRDRRGEGISLGVRGNLGVRAGDYDAAIRDYEEDLQVRETMEGPGTAHHIRVKQAEVFLKQGALDEAERLLLEIEPKVAGLTKGFCRKALAKVCLAKGDFNRAAETVAAALEAESLSPEPYLRAFLLRLAARLAQAGQPVVAERSVEDLLRESDDLFARDGLHTERAAGELYRALLAGKVDELPRGCQKAASLLEQQVREAPGAEKYLRPWIDELKSLAGAASSEPQRVTGRLREIVTCLEY